ncbi:MAG TPA: c-type cytochrome [Anaerolineales bacterium]|nr:c-type cytochrome [Anaerolineales bacterium]
MNNNRIQVEIILGTIAILASSIILVVVGFGQNDKLVASEVIQKAESIEFGAKLYTDNCSECHGLHGEGVFGPPFNDAAFFTTRLAEVGWSGSLEDYIVATASSGRPVSTRPDQWPGKPDSAWKMPAWSTDYGGPLRPDQIRAIAKYIMNWQSTALGEIAQPDVIDLPALRLADPVVRGKSVFLTQGCIACHTIQGVSTGAVGPELTQVGTNAETRVAGQSAEEYIHTSIIDPNAFIVSDCPPGPCANPSVMPLTFGETLSEQQLADLVAYLLSLK